MASAANTGNTLRSQLEPFILDYPKAKYSDYKAAYPDSAITENQYYSTKTDVLRRKPRFPQKPAPQMITDKKIGKTDWREWVEMGIQAQELADKASSSQDFAHVKIPDQKEPLLLLPFSDTHIGAWTTNLKLFRQMTDEMLELGPARARIILLGDLAEMAIRMRGVGEVTNNMWNPAMQADVIESWFMEIEHMVMAATWDNHAIEREERASGVSTFKRLLMKYFVYHDGIGNLDLTVGKETYKLVLSHKFGGYSIYNKTHGPNRYLKFEGADREIAIQGDIHTPAFGQYYDGPNFRTVITCGSTHTKSLYARRHFSLYTIPDFPCVEVYPDRHQITPYWSLGQWKAAKEAHENDAAVALAN